MRIKLEDIDSHIPNLALIKLYTFHKGYGDEVGFTIQDPEVIYRSKIFKGNDHEVEDDPRVIRGGSGYDRDADLPDEIEFIRPDYSLYDGMICNRCLKLLTHCKCGKDPLPGDMNFSLGYTTRGCIRKCPFCIVPKKEGPYRRHQAIEDFHDPTHKIVLVLDNNIYADREWFYHNTDYLLEHDLTWNVVQGMDIRILDHNIANRLYKMKWYGSLHFAWDDPKDEREIFKGIEILRSTGFDLKHEIDVFVLVNFNTTFEQDLYRVRKLRSAGVNAYVMIYDGKGLKKKNYEHYLKLKALQRYTARRWIYWSIDFNDYTQKVRKT